MNKNERTKKEGEKARRERWERGDEKNIEYRIMINDFRIESITDK